MSDQIHKVLSEWFDSDAEIPESDSDVSASKASEIVADSILIHGLLSDIGSRNDDAEADRIHAVMQRIDAESESAAMNNAAPYEPQRRRWFAMLTSALTITAALMVMFFIFGPHQSVSAAMASLEKVVEAAARPLDRTYSVRVIEEYPRDKRPRNLPQEDWDRRAEEQIDGATLFVRGANQYVMTVMLSSGEKRTSGFDGKQSWAFRQSGPVRVSTDPNRFRGGVPGGQQDIPFLNIHANLSQLRTGYDIELGDEHENAGNGAALSKLIGVRKSRDVRGPKQVEIWFDADSGTVHKMLLDGLPRGGGGPKSLTLELIDQSDLDSQFFFHESHHELGRRVVSE